MLTHRREISLPVKDYHPAALVGYKFVGTLAIDSFLYGLLIIDGNLNLSITIEVGVRQVVEHEFNFLLTAEVLATHPNL